MRRFSVSVSFARCRYRYVVIAHSSVEALMNAHDAHADHGTISVRAL